MVILSGQKSSFWEFRWILDIMDVLDRGDMDEDTFVGLSPIGTQL